jgi:L-ascorbate metabolism protein UlaG (beta-lactamase superfamily)
MQLRYLGHSAWQIQAPTATILIDPFLTGNPLAPVKADDLHADYILVSHAHSDHLGDTVAIAKRTGATVISTFEVANLCAEQGCKTHGMHVGGKHAFPFGYVRVTLAFHGAGVPGGHACGFVVNVGGKRIYHAGDTALFGDMALIGKLESPLEVALLPIGDNYTMGPDDALLAVDMLQARTVVPMHYGTFPVINVDPRAWATRAAGRGSRIVVVDPGKSLDL